MVLIPLYIYNIFRQSVQKIVTGFDVTIMIAVWLVKGFSVTMIRLNMKKMPMMTSIMNMKMRIGTKKRKRNEMADIR